MSPILKSGNYGKYNGIEYKITTDMENNIKILTKDKSKIDHTFEDKYNSGVFTKIVNPSELVDCVSIETYGIIQGEKVQILQENEHEFQVATGSLLIGEKLNLPRVDRDMWLGWVSKSGVKVIEEKISINPHEL
ncbi:hypothetical protein [Bacillus sp. B-jedd]|uniref:hypothetical protein n=1 Tax=Bacillus sp. B-jedd TaxID=1476857 RepID=UPI00051557F0|nr:hypothetical protein [Bacillus sp. B-jedd]CEG26921.1 Hypothetical protein BN1002_01774 [Bacillus sp. B-jedd]